MKKSFLTVIMIIFTFTSCSLPANKSRDSLATAVEATLAFQSGIATTLAETAMAAPAVDLATEAPTLALPTETLPPMTTTTDVPVVKIITTVNANCRYGPAKVFALTELLKAGANATVVGQNTANGQWWKIKTEAGKECWILGDNVSISGDISTIAELMSPATPTPVPPPSWNGYWSIGLSTNASNPEGSLCNTAIDIRQSGNQVTTQFHCNGSNIVMEGVVSADGMYVSGSLNYGGEDFVLRLYRMQGNLNQFQGKFYAANAPGFDGAFCGGINGAGLPSPCRP